MKRIDTADLAHIHSHTQGVWESLRGKHIFITGGTGFFGKWLLASFLYAQEKEQLGAKLFVLTRNPESFLDQYPFFRDDQSIQFIAGDIRTYAFDLAEPIDYIIHAATAASAELNQQDPLMMLDTITLGTRRVLDFAHAKSVTGMLMTSSGAIYGKQPAHVSHTKEDDSFYLNINDSRSAYAEGKRMAELYCASYAEKLGVAVKIARCYAFVGPYLPLDTHFAIGNFINNVLQKEDIIIKSDGSTIRSYMYASDLMVWLWTILVRGEVNFPYNVGSDAGINLRSLTTHFQLAYGNKVLIQGEAIALDKVDIYVPNTEKAVRAFGFPPLLSLEDSITKTVQFYQSNA